MTPSGRLKLPLESHPERQPSPEDNYRPQDSLPRDRRLATTIPLLPVKLITYSYGLTTNLLGSRSLIFHRVDELFQQFQRRQYHLSVTERRIRNEIYAFARDEITTHSETPNEKMTKLTFERAFLEQIGGQKRIASRRW